MPAVQTAHAYLTATLAKIPLRTIMDVTAPEHYGDLGFDTAVSGPVKMEWGGPSEVHCGYGRGGRQPDICADGCEAQGCVGQCSGDRTGGGALHGQERDGGDINKITLQMPQIELRGSGRARGERGRSADRSASGHDGAGSERSTTSCCRRWIWKANGKRGTAAIPVVLHGALQFNGTARGAIADLDVKGHLQATNAEFEAGNDGRTDRFGSRGCGVFAEHGRAGGEFDDQAGERGVECRAGTMRPRKGSCDRAGR